AGAPRAIDICGCGGRHGTHDCDLIVAPSIRFLFHARGLPLHGPSDSSESPGLAPHRAVPAARSTDKSAVATAAFAPEPTPVRVPEAQVFRKEPSTDIKTACRRYRFPRRHDPRSSVPDFSRCAVWPRAATPTADRKSPRRSDIRWCIPASILQPAGLCTTHTWLRAD